MSVRLLVIDDEPAIRNSLAKFLRDRKGFQVDAASDGVEGLEHLMAVEYDLVLTDLVMPRMDGLELIRRVRGERPEVPVIVLSGRAVFRDVVEAMRAGAYDFIAKPVEDLEELAAVVDRALERRRLIAENETLRDRNRALQETLGTGDPADEIVGESEPFRRALGDAKVVAPTDSTVLLRGETGTGKELVARAIHRLSRRKDQPLVVVNCAAVPATLIESELFGHEKGAFTGAVQRRRGRFELAHGGTLFLDEVGNIPLELQAKLLRALQEKATQRLGATKAVSWDARVLSATNADLKDLASKGRFREDLLYRLAGVEVTVPPLRERRGDIAVLLALFLRRWAYGRPGLVFTPEAIGLLEAWPWPGNVRELEHAVNRAAALAAGPAIGPESLPGEIRSGRSPGLPGASGRPAVKADLTTLEEMKRRYARQALGLCGGNKAETARVLGVDPKTLRALLQD
jgi:DNA-binding NtrC family response regulator